MNSKGFSLLISIIIVVLLALAAASYYLVFTPEKVVKDPQLLIEEKIEKVIKNRMAELGMDSGFGSEFSITNINNNYARGKVIIDGITKDVYLVAINDEWVIAEISEEPMSCERAEKIGFPSGLVSDCLYKYPDAEEVSVVLAKIKDGLISVDEIEIIGEINLGDDPLSDTFEIISDNGESITININPDNQLSENINDGDYVVIDVSVSVDENGEVILGLNTIEEVETLDILNPQTDSNDSADQNNDLNNLSDLDDSSTSLDTNDSSYLSDQDDTSSTTNDSNTDDTSGTNITPGDTPGDTSGTSIISEEPIDEEYDITNLSSDTSGNYFESLIDRDNSSLDVQIISDF